MPIKKGDRLILNQFGAKVAVEAASDERDGSLEIKYGEAFSTVNVDSVQQLDWDAVHVTGHTTDPNDARPPCPTCGRPGTPQLPNRVDVVRHVIDVGFRCDNQHTWRKQYPLESK